MREDDDPVGVRVADRVVDPQPLLGDVVFEEQQRRRVDADEVNERAAGAGVEVVPQPRLVPTRLRLAELYLNNTAASGRVI